MVNQTPELSITGSEIIPPKKSARNRLFFISFIVIIIILASYFMMKLGLSTTKEKRGDLNIPQDSESNNDQKLLSGIPEEQLYYYFQNKKINLVRKSDEKGIYFLCSDKSKMKMRINRELIAAVWPKVPEDKITKVFNQESLDYVKEFSGLGNISGDTYKVNTTRKSKFQDAIQISNYLKNNYEVIKYAEPNFQTETAVTSNINEQIPSSDSSCSKYDPNYKEKSKLYIPEWDYLYSFDKISLKEAFNLFYQHSKILDLVFLEYRSSYMDSTGKSDIYTVTGYSPSRQKIYTISALLPDPTIQSRETNILLGNKEASKYAWWENKNPTDYHYWQIGTMKDSPELIAEAISEKGQCDVKISFQVVPVLPNAIINCKQNNYWNAEIPLQ